MEWIGSSECCRAQPYRFPRHSVPIRTHPYNKFAGTCRFLAAAGFQIRICTDENGGKRRIRKTGAAPEQKGRTKILVSGLTMDSRGTPYQSVPIRTISSRENAAPLPRSEFDRLLRGPAGQRLFRGANGSFSPSAKTVSSMM